MSSEIISTTLDYEIVNLRIFNSADECNKLKPSAVDKIEENFDRLGNELAKMF